MEILGLTCFECKYTMLKAACELISETMSQSSAQTICEPSAVLAEFLATLSSSVELGGQHSVSVPGAGGGSERQGGARWRSPWQRCGEGEKDKRGVRGLSYSIPPLRFKVSGCGEAARRLQWRCDVATEVMQDIWVMWCYVLPLWRWAY